MEITKEYFDQQLSKLATKEDVLEIKVDIIALQDDVRDIKTDLSDVKESVASLDKRDKEDSDAFAKMLLKHDLDIHKLKLKLI